MKLLSHSLLFLFIFLCIAAKEKPDLQKNDLTGKVKSLSVIEYNIKEGTTEKESVKSNEINTYNKQGYLTERKDNNPDGTLKYRFVYSYNAKGYLDDYAIFNPDGTQYSDATNTYDKNWNKVETIVYKPVGTVLSKNFFTYDKKGNVVERIDAKADGTVKFRSTWSYDEKGNIIEQSDYGSSGELSYRFTYKYDSRGNKIEEAARESPALEFWYDKMNTYDAKGNLTESKKFGEYGALKSKQTYKYDERNNRIEVSLYDPDLGFDDKYTYEYIYDKAGNWITETQSKGGKTLRITERVIEYY